MQLLSKEKHNKKREGEKKGKKENHIPLNAILPLPLPLRLDPLLEEVIQRGPKANPLVRGHGEATGGADLMDIDEDDAAGSRDDIDTLGFHDVGKLGRAVLQRRALAEDAQDARRAGEGVEHDGDAAVARLVQVRRRLDAAAGQVHVPELADHDVLLGIVAVGVSVRLGGGCSSRIVVVIVGFWFLDDAEERSALVGHALGRDVDVAVARERGRGDVEDLLLQEPGDQ